MSRKLWTIIGLCIILVVGGALGIILNNHFTRFRPHATPNLPADGHAVSGNGGNAVMVGPYLFFVANFIAIDSITYRQNEHNRVEYGGIYRLRMAENGRPGYDNDFLREQFPHFTDENLQGHFGDEWNSRLDTTGWELRPIVPKIAGFERTAIWVFGNYLVYASPNNNQNRFGELQSDRLDFFRVDLTGAGHRRLFTMATPNATAENFTVTQVPVENNNHRTYLLVRDGARIVRVSVCTNPGRVHEIADNVTSHAFPVVHTYTEQTYRAMNAIMRYVYFTTPREEGSPVGGNLLKRFRLSATSDAEILSDIADRHFVAMSLTGNNFMFSMTDVTAPNSRWLFVATSDNRNLFTGQAVLVENFLATRIFQPEDNFFLSNEISHATPRFISHHGNDISLFIRNASGEFVAQRLNVPAPVQSVINVGASHIFLLTTDDRVLIVDWNGNIPNGANEPIVMANRTAGSMNLSTFSRIDAQGRIATFQETDGRGNALSEMFFYMQTVTSRYDGTSITIATIVDSRGRAFRIGEIPQEFFQEPDEVVVDDNQEGIQ